MKVICITGRIGSGKSVVLDILREYGAEVLDADHISRQVTEPGMQALEDISRIFGSEYLTQDGHLNRRKLGELVFSDRNKLDILEDILYNSIERSLKEYIAQASERNIDIIAIEAINPFDKRFIKMFDEIWTVFCDEDTQIKRVEERDGLEHKQIENRINSQKTFEEYKEISTRLICNNGLISDLKEKVKEILGEL